MKKLYAPNKAYLAGFPTLDNNGWYKEISDEEFSALMEKGNIKSENGIYIYANNEYVPNEGIYSNPGAALKGIATTICIIGIIVSVIVAVIVGRLDYEFNFFWFLGVAVVGALISYLSGLGLAAFGDLVMNVNVIRSHITK